MNMKKEDVARMAGKMMGIAKGGNQARMNSMKKNIGTATKPSNPIGAMQEQMRRRVGNKTTKGGW